MCNYICHNTCKHLCLCANFLDGTVFPTCKCRHIANHADTSIAMSRECCLSVSLMSISTRSPHLTGHCCMLLQNSVWLSRPGRSWPRATATCSWRMTVTSPTPGLWCTQCATTTGPLWKSCWKHWAQGIGITNHKEVRGNWNTYTCREGSCYDRLFILSQWHSYKLQICFVFIHSLLYNMHVV